MTTNKVIASTADSADRSYLTVQVAVKSSLLISAITTSMAFLMGFSFASLLIVGVVFTVVIFGMCVGWNIGYANGRVEFLQSISDAVEKETGHVMTRRNVLSFLFSGKAQDGKGRSLRLQNTRDELAVVLVEEPVSP